MLNSKGPKMEPCGTPRINSSQSLNIEPNFTLCFLLLRKLKMNFKLLKVSQSKDHVGCSHMLSTNLIKLSLFFLCYLNNFAIFVIIE